MRKIRITVLALALAALFTATALAAGTQAVGDVNGSGDVDMTDMQCLYELLSTGKYSGSLSGEAGRKAADINGDGTVDILDYQRLYDILRQQVDYSNPVYEYDENGRIIKKYHYNDDGCIDRYWAYSYDASSRMIDERYCDADGRILSRCAIEYGADGSQRKAYYQRVSTWEKIICEEVYDANGIRREYTTFDIETGSRTYGETRDANGVMRSAYKWDPQTERTIYLRRYDEKGRIIYESYDVGDQSEVIWKAVYDETDGSQIRSYYDPYDSEPDKVTRVEIYDANGTLRKSTQYDTRLDVVTCVSEYDDAGNKIRFTQNSYYRDTSGYILESYHMWEYDTFGNILSDIIYDVIIEDYLSRTKYEYNDAGKLICKIEYDCSHAEEGSPYKEERTYYDPETGRVCRVELYYSDGVIETTYYNYDENGNVTSETVIDRGA